MPHVTDYVLKQVLERGYAHNAGELAALLAHESIKHLKFNGWGFNKRAEVIAALTSTLDEFRKNLSEYEDIKAEENGNIFSKLEEQMRPKND